MTMTVASGREKSCRRMSHNMFLKGKHNDAKAYIQNPPQIGRTRDRSCHPRSVASFSLNLRRS